PLRPVRPRVMPRRRHRRHASRTRARRTQTPAGRGRGMGSRLRGGEQDPMSRKYRNRPTRDYTVLRNAALRNPALSLKAKGALALMLTFPDDWEYHLDHLEAMSRDGRDALRSAVRELEAHGYVKRFQRRRPDGTLGDAEYHVTDDVPTVDGKTVAGQSVAGRTVAGKPAATKTDLTKTDS